MKQLLTPLPQLHLNGDNHLGVPMWRETIENEFEQALTNGVSIRHIVKKRCDMIDDLLIQLYQLYQLDKTNLAIFATGGYGRGELHPCSDVDILLLSPNNIDDKLNNIISPFVAKLWDIGIEPALVVRSVADSHQACKNDITVATNLLEARFLFGNHQLTTLPFDIVYQHWTHSDFYQSKINETKARYLKHNATEYNLEPDIKNAPGGLRDIHVVGWIAKRYFQVQTMSELLEKQFLTQQEFDKLQQAEDFLWIIRHHLHRLTGRNENRLLFDFQKNIAKNLGYDANQHSNASVEQFMRDYYRFAMSNSTLSEMLVQHYYETYIEPNLPENQQPNQQMINQYFKRIGEKIAINHAKVFHQHPETILQLFLFMGQLNIKHIHSDTLRLLKIYAKLINQNYRDNPVHQQLFLDNLKEQNLLYQRLRMMKRYDVLGNYLPAFAQVTGLMQYDLFHRYTVDAHTLLLIRVLHRFTDNNSEKNYDSKFPLAGPIYRRIDKKEIIVLAGLFHDIAKGRGGDHSELGEQDAINFCRQHGLSEANTQLVGWLVKNHLLMSHVAQKKDISDPEVIANFAEKVGNVTYLNHLYVLTVADINATNPQIWNSWRVTLMKQLYTQTRRVLRADMETPSNRTEMIATNKAQVQQLLEHDKDFAKIEQLWQSLGDEYFLREIPHDIIWHSKAIIAHQETAQTTDIPLIVLREHRELALDAVQVFIYTKDQANLFASTMVVFDSMNLDVLDARIITTTQGFALDSFVLLDRHGTLLTDENRQHELTERLISALSENRLPTLVQKRLPRQLKHFKVPTKINFEFHAPTNQHIMSLETLDQPALLARVGQVFLAHQIEVHYARITTMGERAEDMFYITACNYQTLTDQQLIQLKQAITDALEQTLV